MYNKYIVLKKTGAALTPGTKQAERYLKGGKGEPSTPVLSFFLKAFLLSEIPSPFSLLRDYILKFPFFHTTQKGIKRENLPTNELKNPRTIK